MTALLVDLPFAAHPVRDVRSRDVPSAGRRAGAEEGSGSPVGSDRPRQFPPAVTRCSATAVAGSSVLTAGSSRTEPRTRLTRRGRAVVAGSAAAFVAAVWAGVLAVGYVAAPAATGPVSRMERVVVQPGETLWSIARVADPPADTSAVVQRMMLVNALPGPWITPGERLAVPGGAGAGRT